MGQKTRKSPVSRKHFPITTTFKKTLKRAQSNPSKETDHFPILANPSPAQNEEKRKRRGTLDKRTKSSHPLSPFQLAHCRQGGLKKTVSEDGGGAHFCTQDGRKPEQGRDAVRETESRQMMHAAAAAAPAVDFPIFVSPSFPGLCATWGEEERRWEI